MSSASAFWLHPGVAWLCRESRYSPTRLVLINAKLFTILIDELGQTTVQLSDVFGCQNIRLLDELDLETFPRCSQGGPLYHLLSYTGRVEMS